MEFGGKYLIVGLVLVIIVGLYVGYAVTVQNTSSSCSVTKDNVEPAQMDEIRGVIENPTNESQTTVDSSPLDEIDDIEGAQNEEELSGNMIEEGSVKAETADSVEPKLVFFWAAGCNICKAEKNFLEEIEHKYPELEIIRYGVDENESNLKKMKQACSDFNLSCQHVPITIIGNTAFENFKDYDGKPIRYSESNGYVGYSNLIESTIVDLLSLKLGNSTDEVETKDLKNYIKFDAYPERDKYYEGEDMWVFCSIDSKISADRVKVDIEGIDGRFNDEQKIDLGVGENRVVFERNAPNCFSCANFKPGKYDVEVVLRKDQEIIDKKEFTIEIRENED